MPFEKISASQFADQLRTAIAARNNTYDMYTGPVPDLSISPHSRVYELQNDRVRKLSLIMSLANEAEFEDGWEVDLEGIVFNENMTRGGGSFATATVTFSRSSAPSSDIRVQRGYPVASAADESTGQTLIFVTTEEAVMYAAGGATSYFNSVTNRFELQVPVVATVEGEFGRVGARRINRPMRPLAGFDTIVNAAEATGGRDPETNAELIERYLLAILGTELATSTGVQRAAGEPDYPDVDDSLVVRGANPLLTREDDDAGAVDTYIIGALTTTAIENLYYSGPGQLIAISFPPLSEVLSVTDLDTGVVYIEGTDYEVVFDTDGYARSTRGQDGIQFLSTAVSGPAGGLPNVGLSVAVEYTYNNLIRSLQSGFEQDDTEVHGRDLLFKEGTQLDIALEAGLRQRSGFSYTTVRDAVKTALGEYINGLGLGDDIEESDLQSVVRAISGVDNFIITRLTLTTVATGTGDFIVGDNAYPRIDAGTDLIITSL